MRPLAGDGCRTAWFRGGLGKIPGWIGIGFAGALAVAAAGCEGMPEWGARAVADRSAATASAPPLDRPVLYQPNFVWADGSTTVQGTGFLTRAANGRVVAVTSVHFLRRDGPALVEARWVDLRSRSLVANFSVSWGPAGDLGITEPLCDISRDYLLMPAPAGAAPGNTLELDPRVRPREGERVWFPDKDPSAPLGFRVVEGQVAHATDGCILVRLDARIRLQSQSGSPIVSQATGKVIGTLSRGGDSGGRTALLLAPSHAIVEALASEGEFPLLREIIGIDARGPGVPRK